MPSIIKEQLIADFEENGLLKVYPDFNIRENTAKKIIKGSQLNSKMIEILGEKNELG